MDLFGEALTHHQRGEIERAVALYEKLLQQQPRHADALHLIGVATAQRGDFSVASAWMRRALDAQPGTAVFQQNLASTLVNLGGQQRQQGDLNGAARSFEEALQWNSELWQARLNLGGLLAECGKRREAERHLLLAQRQQPDSAEIAYALGSLWAKEGRVSEAEPSLRRALESPATAPPAHCNLGQCLKEQGRLEEALHHFKEALRLKPGWRDVEANILYTLAHAGKCSAEEVFAAHVAWGKAQPRPAAPISPRPVRRDGKLRIGYVSADFREHALMYFFEMALERHDRERFDIFLYACTSQQDAVTQRARAFGHAWRCIEGMDDATAAALIRADEIDLLVDLGGHMAANRLTLFTHRPAPIQISYVGYPLSTGLAELDYRITDAEADPPELSAPVHTEKLWYLPRCGWCYRPLNGAPEPGPLPALKSGHVTFGSFNRWDKIHDEVLDWWSEILRRCPGSRLLLKTKVLCDEKFAATAKASFARAGIAPERIEVAGNAPEMVGYLKLFQRVDIALDPFPYNGNTTTMESLWMGIPVIALEGDRGVARISASWLKRIGLSSCVGGNREEYIARACALAADIPALAALRAELRLRVAGSELRDEEGFTRAMEAAYEQMAACHAG